MSSKLGLKQGCHDSNKDLEYLETLPLATTLTLSWSKDRSFRHKEEECNSLYPCEHFELEDT